jgi:hypothetical protein
MHALINLSELRVVRYVPESTVCRTGYAVVPVLPLPEPVYDPATEKVVTSTRVYADRVNIMSTVVKLSEQELADVATTRRDVEFEEAINAGYEIPGTGVVLDLAVGSRNTLTQYATLLNIGCAEGHVTDESPVLLVAKDGVAHDFTYGQFKNIMLGFGQYFYSLYAAHVGRSV